jgi:hypothetical protein
MALRLEVDDDYDEYVPLTFAQWKLKYRPTPAPEASQTSKRTRSSRRHQLSPDEELSLVKLALEWKHILRFADDQKEVDTAVALAFEDKHGWPFRAVRSKLLDMERKWRSGTRHGFSYDLCLAIMEWSKMMDVEREAKAQELIERRIEREILGWDRDSRTSLRDPPVVEKADVATSKLRHVCVAFVLLWYVIWMISEL